MALAGGTPLVGLKAAQFELPAGASGEQTLEALPGKVPLVKKAYRPPNYEMPFQYFSEEITPNNAFFVRYHLADIPEEIDPQTWTLKIDGAGAKTPMEVNLADLKAMEKIEIVAVNQCSGNRRGFSNPHVPGVEWGFGAMGNAKWGGVRLRDLLEKAGVGDDTVEVAAEGSDGPVLDTTPDFIKSLPTWKARDENTLVAYEMNGEPLPHLNGAPVRLVVPGWTGTYWMKHLNHVAALTEPLKSYWMNPAYRVPSGMFPLVQRFASQEAPNSPNTPITEMVVNSLVTNVADGASIKKGEATAIKGIAWDGGYGIAEVAISTDEGKMWQPATLGNDLGRFSWRTWSYSLTPDTAGSVTVRVRARNNAGQTQVDKALFNGAGYHNNVVQSLTLTVS
jgi:DMSO/TMAO reductase YedYZ molybdopterin-dependent catalytic subunit